MCVCDDVCMCDATLSYICPRAHVELSTRETTNKKSEFAIKDVCVRGCVFVYGPYVWGPLLGPIWASRWSSLSFACTYDHSHVGTCAQSRRHMRTVM